MKKKDNDNWFKAYNAPIRLMIRFTLVYPITHKIISALKLHFGQIFLFFVKIYNNKIYVLYEYNSIIYTIQLISAKWQLVFIWKIGADCDSDHNCANIRRHNSYILFVRINTRAVWFTFNIVNKIPCPHGE